MADNQTMIFIFVALIIGIYLIQKRKPEQMWKYRKLGASILITSAVWLWYERIAMFTSQFEYGLIFLLVFFALIVWILLGVYRAEPPA